MQNTLDYIFRPRSVAIVGASRHHGKIGYEILRNLKEYGFKGAVYPLNPKAETIQGFKVYSSVPDIPGSVDLAVIAVPAKAVPTIMDQLGEKRAKGAAIISSGFSEIGNKELEDSVMEKARRAGIRVIGPNIFGIFYSPARLNATFGPTDVKPGSIAFITQSGALGIALMGWTVLEKIGLSSIVSVGNKADVDDADLLAWFKEDPATKVILIYMEGIKDGRRFMEEAKKVTAIKPVIVLKAGRGRKGMIAASSHTGSMAGADEVYSASFHQTGILRAVTVEQAFDWATAFDSGRIAFGNRVGIVTNGGGAGVIATDACEDHELDVIDSPDDLRYELRDHMPEFGSTKNPIDLTGMATHEEFKGSLTAVLRHDSIDCGIGLYCETAVTDPSRMARAFIEASTSSRKPLVVGMIGGERVERALDELNEHKVPAYPDITRTVSAVAALVRWSRRREVLSSTS